MASKRKSTTPCMIPSKIIRPLDEVEQDAPVLLRQSKLPGGDRHSPLDPGESSKPEAGDNVKDGVGTYTCKPCNFETHDLNLFLDHVYTGHPDFRTDPSFFCVSCGVSAPKFEGLALHNARVHPSTINTTLQLRKRDRRVVVEQNLVTGTDSQKDSEISITKTPIMRMLKGKSEPKRIVVSHLVTDESASDPHATSASRETERKEPAAVTVTHVPTIVHNGTTKVTLPSAIQIVNGSGALPMLKTPITQVVSVVQNRSLHQSAPITASSNVSSTSSTSSSKNLPKVMIPLSSIPTYSASMDSSSFLKTSFSKFPYPTKAELCYLTVVTKFPEEQIKIWFTAQRLKQGISWSPEEIEEARRKMFNTIIQTAPSSSQNQTQSQPSPAQHTITVLPASLGATGIPHILQGSLVSQGGVIVTQPVMANGIQVNSAPVALAVTPKPQAAARPMMQARPAAALVADKGVSMVVGTVGSSSTGSNIISNSSRSGGGGSSSISSSQASVINLSLGSSDHSNGKVSSVNGKHSNGNADCNEKSNSNVTSHVNAKKTEISKGNTKTVQCDNKVITDSRNSTDRPVNSNSKTGSDGQKSKDTDSSIDSATTSTSTDDVEPTAGDSPTIKMEEASSPASKSSSPTPVAPSSSTPGSRTPVNAFLDPSFYKGKKSQEQLNALKHSFQVSQFPDQEEVDRLIALTGLTVREVRKWFSDRRYHFRNLKGTRTSTGAQNKSGTPTATKSSSSTPGSGTAGSANPVDLSEGGSNSGAKTPQHSSAPLSPSPTQTPTSPTTPSRRLPRPPSPDFTAIRYKEREPHQVKALEASFTQGPDPSGEEVDRLRSETKMTRREIHGWFADRRKRMAAEKKKEEAERAMREEEEVDEEERQREDSSGELKVNPIKINLKMLRVTEANGKAEGDESDSSALPLQVSTTPATSPGPTPSSTAKPSLSSTPTTKSSHSPKPTAARGKKTAEQLHLLKQVYARTQWPSAAQYDELISATGLPRPEVVRWFGDCRYVQKNGQLKWLEAYQNMTLEEDLQKGNTQILQDHLEMHGRLEESQLQELAQKSGLTTDLVQHWFSTKASLPRVEQTAAARSTGPRAVASGVAAESQTTGSSPLEPQPGGGMEVKMEQSVCGVTAEAEKATTDKTVNPTEGTN
ncbi:zinc fingers and homeoboxes protein 3 [Mastacembelus armatus]|uniref:Zinc fingers and homeoboxes 3b n=1 Tax=Mastacembelus armatus TaxID=205130 RepID=A0A3Q3LMZ7_9TELE|nr:zinc fingers and homeoboxes protein 3-like [Mastacembelus armatus]